MKKEEFLSQLKKRINTLSGKDIDDVINYYNELIIDRVENGENEEDVIVSLGSLDMIASNILEEKKSVQKDEPVIQEVVTKKEETKKNSWGIGKILLIILASPFLLALLIILIAFFITFLGILIGLIAISFSFIFTGVFSLIGSFVHMSVNFPTGLIQFGLSLIILSLSVLIIKCIYPFLFKIIKTGFLKIKNSFKKENR